MFYAFRPADTDPASKPLAVIFNGGPGYATTIGLFPLGTGPRTIVPRAAPGTAPVPNLRSWSRFANLLYVDERGTGFSYELTGADASPPPDCSSNDAYFADAADFVRVLLAFLDTHTWLAGAKVVVVGESYGGTRAMAMLDLLLRYSTTGARVADDLAPAIEAHYRKLFPDVPAPIPEEVAATQFGRAVLLEPLVAGAAQMAITDAMSTSDPDLVRALAIPQSTYDTLVPPNAEVERVGLAALADPAGSLALFGVDLATVPELLPSARARAFRRPNAEVGGKALGATNQAFASRFGALRSADDYYRVWVPDECLPPIQGPGTTTGTAVEFGKNLKTVKMFLSRAALDTVLWSPAIVKYMQDHLEDPSGAPAKVVVDENPRPGVARPGWIRPGPYPEIRYPLYATSGHAITKTEPDHLADDVEAWLAETR
jgi:hypothetical protein